MNSPKLLKTNVPYLLKDTASGAIINTNKARLEAVKARKKSLERIDKIEMDVTCLSVEIKQQSKNLEKITMLLEQVLSRNSGGQ
jgi:hypothetical protein